MKFELGTNYTIISNSIDQTLLDKFEEYTIINDITYEELSEKVENYLSKTIVFNDILRNFSIRQKKKIIELIKLRNMNFINITSNIEETLLGEYIVVFDHDKIIMEGPKEPILKEEKILKRLGFGLPFIVDLSIQLNYYGVINKIYYDTESLVNDLWN